MVGRAGRPRNRERKGRCWRSAALKRVRDEYSRKAKEKGIEWSISDWLLERLVLANCHYCHTGPSNFKRQHTWPVGVGLKYNGLDRKDNSMGYTPENVVTCCKKCNKLKSNVFTVDETKAMVRALLRYNARTGKKKPT